MPYGLTFQVGVLVAVEARGWWVGCLKGCREEYRGGVVDS